MSVDLSGANRELFFVNLTAVGTESLNGHQEFCTAKQTYRDAPLLHQQDKYLVCATRWMIPTSEMPTIEPTWFEIWEYNGDDVPAQDPTADYVAPQIFSEFAQLEAEYEEFPLWDKFLHFQMLRRFEIGSANSAYEWFGKIQSALSIPITTQTEAYGHYSDRVKFTMLPDMRVCVWISNEHDFTDYQGHNIPENYGARKWYIKMSQGMFDMCQFQISRHDPPLGLLINYSNHTGRRFFGDGQGDTKTIETDTLMNINDTLTQGHLMRSFVVSTSATSAADMFNCHRRLVLTSDLITKQERMMVNFGSRKRQLVEYDLTQNTTFSYQIRTSHGSDPYEPGTHFLSRTTTVQENLPSARTYTSKGGVDGRWMQLSSPSPLYQLEVTAHLIIWSFENRRFEQRPISLPAGGVFDVKLAFVNRDTLLEGKDHHHR